MQGKVHLHVISCFCVPGPELRIFTACRMGGQFPTFVKLDRDDPLAEGLILKKFISVAWKNRVGPRNVSMEFGVRLLICLFWYSILKNLTQTL